MQVTLTQVQQNTVSLVLCMQETEINKDLDHDELKISEYCLELEQKSVKSRVGFYVSKC